MASAEGGVPLNVQVSYSPAPREVDTVSLQLHLGSTVTDALRASGLLERHGLSLDEHLSVGVWTKLRPLDSLLRENDRIEIYRPLKVDPKEARRQRYRKQKR
jgi:putative ubiquitin-RnfH superfamily antitoxin RatB of RatAB toxin-antitoxin module